MSIRHSIKKLRTVKKPPYHTTHNLRPGASEVLQRGMLFYPESVNGYTYDTVVAEGRNGVCTKARDITPCWSTPPVEYFVFKECFVDSSSGVVFDPDKRRYYIDFSWGWGKPRSMKRPVFKSRDARDLNLQNPVYCITGSGYHGIVEDVPIVFNLFSLFPDIKVIISRKNKWVKSLLCVLGFPVKSIIFSESEWIKSPNLVAVTKSAFGEFVNPSLIRELQKFSSRLAPPESEHSHKDIYISRESASARAVPEETEVRYAFESVGFQALTLENMTVKEQILSLLSADRLAGFRGAGLVNMAFCRNSIEVLEIDGNGINSYYSSMAAVLGHDYHNFRFDGDISALMGFAKYYDFCDF